MRVGENLLRNIEHVIAGNSARSIIMVVFTIYIIHIISVQDFGVYSTILAFSAITTAFVNFGLDTYLTREISRKRDIFIPMMGAVTRVRFLLFAISEVLLYSILRVLGYSTEITILALFFAFDPLLCFLLDSFYSIFYVEGKTRPVALAEFGKRALLLFLVLFTAHRGLYWIIASYVVADSITLILLYLKYRSVVGGFPREGSMSTVRILKRSFPFSLQALTGIFFWNVDTMMVSKFLGSVPTGFYNVGATIFKAIYFIPQAFNSVLFPRISEAHSEGQLAGLKGPILESMKSLLLIAVGIVLYSQTSISYYIPILFGGKYAPAMKLMGPMSLIVLFYFPAFVGQNILMAIGREGEAVRTLVIANLANFTLNLILIPLFGLIGAVYGTVISQAMFLAATLYYLRDIIPVILPPKELARSLVIGTAAWLLTAGAVALLERRVSPIWADNVYLLTLYLLYRTGVIRVEEFRLVI